MHHRRHTAGSRGRSRRFAAAALVALVAPVLTAGCTKTDNTSTPSGPRDIIPTNIRLVAAYTYDTGDTHGTIIAFDGETFDIDKGTSPSFPAQGATVTAEVLGVGMWRYTFVPASAASGLMVVAINGGTATVTADTDRQGAVTIEEFNADKVDFNGDFVLTSGS